MKQSSTKKKRQQPSNGRPPQAASADPSRWNLRLYVAGQTPRSLTAFKNLKEICEKYLKGQYHIEVIDLMENPTLARGDQILAIPTLVRSCRNRSERSSAISPTPSVCSLVWIYNRGVTESVHKWRQQKMINPMGKMLRRPGCGAQPTFLKMPSKQDRHDTRSTFCVYTSRDRRFGLCVLSPT